MKRLSVVLVLASVVATASAAMVACRGNGANQRFRTAKLERGEIVQVVKATGVIQPIKLVQVGTQVNGPVKKLYVDFNDRVKSGQIVAQIDPAAYEAQTAQNEANLKRSIADVEQIEARLRQAERDLKRAQDLAAQGLVAQSELDAAVANRDALTAQVKLSKAVVEQSKATLNLSQTNLGYTTIRAPVDGVVIDRNVNEGQTVVASLSAQTLFVIATDLKQIQVEASIPEADIGNIRVGEPVSFTVDAYPDAKFHGAVAQIRLAAATLQNVVTYPVIINAENPGEKLFPNMTANISCEVARRENVLKLPNSALRFKPPENAARAGSRSPTRNPEAKASPEQGNRSEIWTPGPEGPKAVSVTLGIADGFFTEVLAGELREGQEVITGLAEQGEKEGTVNPFAPPRFPAQRTTR
ncbi:efflux RND transporter periplasmic adaptor subunit [Candidatus Poribacteria bacterium]|nr:efflux RND transporter periplasmic adaptor subunit [Candidatus Poribacteria bacterium]